MFLIGFNHHLSLVTHSHKLGLVSDRYYRVFDYLDGAFQYPEVSEHRLLKLSAAQVFRLALILCSSLFIYQRLLKLLSHLVMMADSVC